MTLRRNAWGNSRANRPGPTRTYSFADRAGCVQIRRARENDAEVGIYAAAQAGMDDDEGQSPWSILCEEHATVISVRTLQSARWQAVTPTGWCEPCREIAEAQARAADAEKKAKETPR